MKRALVLTFALAGCGADGRAPAGQLVADAAIAPTAGASSPSECGAADCKPGGADAGLGVDSGPAVGAASTPPRHVDAPQLPQCRSIARAELERQVGHPGAGHQLDLRLVTKDAMPAGDLAACLQLRDAQSMEPIRTSAAQHAAEASFSLLLVAAGSSAQASDAAQRAAEALLDVRPSWERIAIYRWGEDVLQLASFATDRRHSREQLAQRLGTRAAPALPVEQAVAAARSDLARLGGDAAVALRSVVVIAPELDLEAVPPPEPKGSVSVLWLVRSASSAALAAADSGSVFTASGLAPSVAELSAHINAQMAAGFYTLGLCSDGQPHALTLELGGAVPPLTFMLEDSLEEERAGACDPGRVASGVRNYPDTLQLRFTPEQRSVYDQAVSMKLQSDFLGSLQLGPALQPTPVTLHLHGEHSLDCARKSFTVDLDRKRGRHLMEGSATDEYHLLLTCQDEFYVHQLTADQLFREIGLFPLRWSMVELTIDGRSNGSYMLLEKYKEQLLQDLSRVTAIIRRRNDAADVAPEVKYAAADEASALADYAQILPDALRGLTGAALERTLRERMDLDRYLAWIALNNVLGSGDYVDELIFYATETRDPSSGQPRPYFTPMAWDTDDTFSPCHDASVNAIFDPYGMLTCAESDFDHFIFADAHMYGLYVDALERALELATEERFSQALQRTKDLLYPLLERDALRAADVEFRDWVTGASTRDDFVKNIDAHAAADLTSLRQIQRALRARVSSYRSSHPR